LADHGLKLATHRTEENTPSLRRWRETRRKWGIGLWGNNIMANKTIQIEIKRQANPDTDPTWEKFELPWKPGMNVISAMMDIAANPINTSGQETTPIAYDSNCLEEICGSCAMVINGKARMACTALIDKLEQPIRLQPLTKFPVVRDLAVDRSVLFENLKAVKAWVPIDGTYDLGEGPRIFPQAQEVAYPLSNCISCTICMEVCPQFNDATGFVGAATIAQVKLFNSHPSGKVLKEERLRALAGDGGVQECGFAQNCVNACPKQLPLTEAISDISRDVVLQQLKDLVRA
jgi:succinate dehydrogenase / fumarate reductase iron-sulfur subunit